MQGDGIMVKRKTVEERWYEQSEAARRAAAMLPYGKIKDQLLLEARQLQTASQINQWIAMKVHMD
jgi:hypothetical protein